MSLSLRRTSSLHRPGRAFGKRLGLGAVVNGLLEGRGFGFALERAVFVSVLHRLFVSGSNRSCEKRMGDYAIAYSRGNVAARKRRIAASAPCARRSSWPAPAMNTPCFGARAATSILRPWVTGTVR